MLSTLRSLRSSIATLAAIVVLASPAASAESAAPVEVAVAELSPNARTIRLTATVTAERQAGLSPRVSGLVAAIDVDAGDRVAAGDVVVELDRALAEIALAAARAAVAEGRARLVEAERLRDEARKLVAERHLPETEERSRAARVDLERAAVARLEVAVRERAEQLERHSIVAPFAGVVRRRLADVGEWVETGTPVLEVVATDRLRLDVQVPQERFSTIDRDTPVAVRLDAVPERSFPGRVAAKVPIGDPSARTFLVRVVIDEPRGMMIPGMSGEVSFATGSEEPALLVPRDALVRTPDGIDRVWVLEEAEGELRAAARDVTIGRTLSESVEIVAGLDRPRAVVVRGNEGLREGQAVRLVGEGRPAR